MPTSRKPNGYDNRGLRLYIRTFGWPLVTVARDGAGDFKEDKCFGVKGLRQIGLKNRNCLMLHNVKQC
jgi:hypothetical protein